MPQLDKEASCSMFTDSQTTWRQVMLTMKARWGHLWNRKLAFRYGMAASDACPLCGEQDSTGHMLGGCPHTQAMRVARHDNAVKIVQSAIAKGSMRGSFTIMDAGAANDLPDSVSGKRLPPWLFRDQDAELGVKMRPDIFIVEGPQVGAAPGEGDRRIHIIEVGYCGDTQRAEKEEEKKMQHQALTLLLRANGHRVTTHVIVLGRCGTIPLSLRTLLRDSLGDLDSARAAKCAKKLSRNAVAWVEKMYAARQGVDRPAQPTTTQNPSQAPKGLNLNPLVRKRRPMHKHGGHNGPG